MIRCPLVVGLAAGELGFDRGAMAVEVAPDEDGLALRRRAVQAEPAELVPPAGEVEETVPVAPGEADDALRADDVGGKPPEEPLERLLPERTRRPVDEAPDAVRVEMVAARAGELPVARDAGREEEVAVDRAADGLEALRAWIQLAEPLPETADRVRVDEIELVHDQEVRRLDLEARDLRLREMPVDVRRVDDRDDGVEPEAGVLHPVRERLRVREPRRLDDD